MRLVAVVVAMTVVLGRPANGQVIRGMVSERENARPLAGVLVSVARIPDSLSTGGLRHTLTNARGEFAVSLDRAGTYQVSAKRIGVVRHVEAPFTLAVGETKRLRIVLAAFESRLPTVRVLGSDLCVRRNDQLERVAALWDEVRTALLATDVSSREHLLSGWLSRHVRTLDPRTLRVLEDRHSVAEGLFDRPMRSISGDSMAAFGYWRRQDEDTLVFHAPDTDALLSDAFRFGHCYDLVTGNGGRRGMIGLAFRPRRNRPIGGIDGTIWIDAGSFELRFVEFRYTNLITIPRNPFIGGEVHYLRYESGAWLVRRWFVRMPRFPEVTPALLVREGIRQTIPKPEVYRLIEEGGGLFTPGQRSWEKPGTIAGMVRDSTGRAALRGSVVSLSGTPYSTEVDSTGAFRFDSIPPGAYTLLASHADYAALGQLVDDEPLTLAAGATYRATLRAISTDALLATLCDGDRFTAPVATLHLQVTHAESGNPLPNLDVWLRWPDPDDPAPADPITPGKAQRLLGVQSRTDEGGAVTFCGVPSGTSLELHLLRSDDDPWTPAGSRSVRVTSFTVAPGEIGARRVEVRPPR